MVFANKAMQASMWPACKLLPPCLLAPGGACIKLLGACNTSALLLRRFMLQVAALLQRWRCAVAAAAGLHRTFRPAAARPVQSRAALQREADNWLQEAGTLPPGERHGGLDCRCARCSSLLLLSS